ncbi:hypothetical protein U91I_00136 [alpha proteobacterium U9-1i]|nr:hypothetical protein U91I_00136 [alpha proteobacterium U9-1i]
MTKLWTIGYENVGAPDFIAALKAAKIKTLLDVREIANSRRAGFSKNILAASLEQAGIAYVHMKPLGTPKAGRDAARKGDIKTMHTIIEKKLDGHEAQAALAEAAAFAKKGRACLMCLEHDWRGCHRANVAKRLEAFGCEAVHLAPEPRA